MSTGNPDLFVICKSCGAEVSPYITECPDCGNRLRKRAPKIDRQGRVSERRLRRPTTPSLGRLRRGEIPGIRPDSRPYATAVLVVLGLVGCLIWRTALVDQDLVGTAAVGVVVALMPLVVTDASWISAGVGALGGVAVGAPMALSER